MKYEGEFENGKCKNENNDFDENGNDRTSSEKIKLKIGKALNLARSIYNYIRDKDDSDESEGRDYAHNTSNIDDDLLWKKFLR